ncbi:MAG: VWA domain-containing protein [Oscillospiraceae bacterium]|nr:VWA domain-containing protein [Oscillospiraceae bacterium]
MYRYRKQLVATLVILFAIFLFPQSVLGVASGDADSFDSASSAHEVILLFDTGASIGLNDPAFLAADAMQQIASSLPSLWHVGLVTFNAQIVDYVPPGDGTWAEIHNILENISYANLTNPNAGLLKAVDLFSDYALSRTIIFLTDEHDNDTAKDLTTDVQQEEEIVAQIAAYDIRMHVVALGDMGDILPTLWLSPHMDGLLLRDLRAEDLSSIASALVFNILGVAGSPQISDANGNFSVRFPAEGIDSARVIVTAESAIEDFAVDSGGGHVDVHIGHRFALIEISDPASISDQMINIALTTAGNSSAELIVEWDLQLMSAAGNDDSARFWLADSEGRNAFLNPFFDRSIFPISVNANELHLEDGYLHWDADEETVFWLLQTHLGAFGINLPDFVATPVSELPPPPAETPATEPAPTDPLSTDPSQNDNDEVSVFPLRTLLGLIIGIILVLAALLFILRLASIRKKAAYPQNEPATDANEFIFAGKLDLYVVNIGATDNNTEDIKPRIFKFPRSRKTSLKDILQKCNLSNTFPGSNQIYFEIDGQGTLQIINGSDCAISVGSNVLNKNEPYKLHHKGNVCVRDIYEISELIISPRFLYQA